MTLTIPEFILALGEVEVLELSRPDDELAPTINEDRVNFAIANAIALIDARYTVATDCGKAFIIKAGKSLIIFIARYLLDIVKRRPFVEDDYKKAMETLEFACKDCAKSCPLSPAEISSILGEPIKKGLVRTQSGATYPRRRISRIYLDFI